MPLFSDHRLTSLRSYQRLSVQMRTAVRTHLFAGVPGPLAALCAGVRHPERSWNAKRVQAVLADYRTEQPKTVHDVVMEMERGDKPAPPARPAPKDASAEVLKLVLEKPKPVLIPEPIREPLKPRPAVKTTKPCERCKDRLAWFNGVLCGPCATEPAGPAEPTPATNAVSPSDIWPRNPRDSGQDLLYSQQVWRRQEMADQEERQRLIREIEARQEPR